MQRSKNRFVRFISKNKIHAAVFVIFVAFIALQIAISSSRASYQKNYELTQAQNRALEAEYYSLQRELEFVKSDKGIELYARAQGMQMPGETRYKAN
ncbi:MAG: septum formation initiator family protein [Clostridia bacterium]|nr:septum formation initiator family protein [Clostridia bacterium]